MKGRGNADVALSVSRDVAETYFAGTNPVSYSRDVVSVSAFAEYGITGKLDVLGTLPLVKGRPQDGSVHLKYRLLRHENPQMQASLLGAIGFSAPVWDYPTESGSAIGARATSFPMRGVLQLETTSGFFLQVKGGYTYSVAPVPVTVPFSSKLGIARERLYFDLWVELQRAIDGKDWQGTGNLAASSFRQLGVSHRRVGGTCHYSIRPDFSVFAGGARVLDGRNAWRATTVWLGGVWKIETK